jgi:hypothetical protein
MVSGTGAGDKNPLHMFCAGVCAGAVGYFFGSPLYQVKNRQQVRGIGTGFRPLCQVHTHIHIETNSGAHGQASTPDVRPSTYQCIRTLARENALFRGASVMVARGAAVTAGQFMGYDLAKTYLYANLNPTP